MAGFTLIEMLIALTLAAVLAATSYRAVALLVASHDRVAESSRRWRDIALFFGRLEGDLLQATVRAERQENPGGVWTPAPGVLMLTRFRGEAGGVETVRYALENATLVLREGDPLAADSPRNADPVLSGVRSVRWEFLGLSDDWSDRWPNSGGMVLLPRALRVTLEVDGIGSLVRIFTPR